MSCSSSKPVTCSPLCVGVKYRYAACYKREEATKIADSKLSSYRDQVDAADTPEFQLCLDLQEQESQCWCFEYGTGSLSKTYTNTTCWQNCSQVYPSGTGTATFLLATQLIERCNTWRDKLKSAFVAIPARFRVLHTHEQKS